MRDGSYVLWSGEDFEAYRDMAEMEFPEASPEEWAAIAEDTHQSDLEDLCYVLNHQYATPILVILVRPESMEYQEISSGQLSDCLDAEALFANADHDSITWYVDRLGDLRCDAIHQDGTTHYLYRVYKDSASPSQIELLKEKLYRGIATRADITRVTRRLGDDIAEACRFSIPPLRSAAEKER